MWVLEGASFPPPHEKPAPLGGVSQPTPQSKWFPVHRSPLASEFIPFPPQGDSLFHQANQKSLGAYTGTGPNPRKHKGPGGDLGPQGEQVSGDKAGNQRHQRKQVSHPRADTTFQRSWCIQT